MIFQVGDDVRFRHTGDSARVTKDNLDGSYMVWCADIDEEIVAFQDDIMLARDFRLAELTHIRAKQEKIKKLSTEEVFYGTKALNKTELYNAALKKELQTEQQIKPILTTKEKDPKVIDNQGYIPATISPVAATNTGLYLAFWQDAPQHFTIYLVNDTPNSVGFKYERYLNNYCEHELHHTIAPHEFYAVDDFKQQLFNEASIIDFESTGINFKTSIRLKYKSFLNKLAATTPLMSASTYLYQLIGADYNPLKAAEKGAALALSEYTKKQLAAQEEKSKPKANQLTPSELLAQFPRVLDLHVESLVDDPKKIVGSMIGFQLNKMEAYLLKASQIGITEVTLIHGIGDGKLKDAVSLRLRTHPLVEKATNEYHPLYGFGATMVKFRLS
jgi:hypothetical protein